MTTTIGSQDVDAPGLAGPNDGAVVETDAAEPHPDGNPVRRAISVGLLCVGTAIVAGGLFTGAFTPRAVAVVTAVLGCVLAFIVRRLRSPTLVGVATVGGIAIIGFAGAILVGGFGAVPDIGDLLSKALTQSDLLRPPIAMTTGFAALVGWLMSGVAFGATWTAVVLQRPAFAMLVPLPVAAITAISAPRDQQIATGTILVGAFAAGIFLLSADTDVIGAEGVPFRYELRRAVRAVPLTAAVVIALIVLAQTDLLFPKPIINPALEAQKPKTIPISDTPDRVLFQVKSKVRGPWVMGVLDVYDGTDWRLPPFDEGRVSEIGRSGVVSRVFRPGIKATITVKGLGGAVLPTLPNTVGVVAEGPKLSFDARSGNIRLVEGEITEGFSYALAGAATPNVKDLVASEPPPGDLVKRFTEAPVPPIRRASAHRQGAEARRSGRSGTISGAGSSTTSPQRAREARWRSRRPAWTRSSDRPKKRRHSRSSRSRPCSRAGSASRPASATASTAASGPAACSRFVRGTAPYSRRSTSRATAGSR